MLEPVDDLLVIVPGILGSRLERNGKIIWGDMKSSIEALLNPEKQLFLNGDGLSQEDDVRATGLVRRFSQLPGLSKIDAYDGLIDNLQRSFSLDSTNFLIFSYDWRLSCMVNAQIMKDKIFWRLKERRAINKSAKLIFICHSMGGRVVQCFTDILGGADDTREVISIGTPFRGSVKAFGAMTRGVPDKLPIVRDRIRRIVQSLPSVYELLPQYKAIVQDNTELRVLSKKDLPHEANSELFDYACEINTELEKQETRPYGRTVIVGSLQPTPQYLKIESGYVRLLNKVNIGGKERDLRGDGTVPRQSITPAEWEDDRGVIPFGHTHVGLPITNATYRVIYNVLTSTPRTEQTDACTKLTIDCPDLVAAGDDIEIACDVFGIDSNMPLLVQIIPLNGGSPKVLTPNSYSNGKKAIFSNLSVGDYKASVSSATHSMIIPPVWDYFSVIPS